MIVFPKVVPRDSRAGYSLVEVMVVAGLMGLMVFMASSAWTELGRASVDAIARSRVAQEACLAIETMQRDLGGNLPESSLGSLHVGKSVGRLIVDGSQLLLCFDGGAANGVADWAAPDQVISYELASDRLLRVNQRTGQVVVVACHIDQLQFSDNGDGVTIDLAVSYRNHTRIFSIIAKDP